MSHQTIRSPGARRVRAELLASLRRTPALAELRSDDPHDPIVALCDAWVALSQLFDFYQQRVLDEAFLSSAEQASSLELLYHSLGDRFPANAAAVTGLAYHLSDKAAGIEAVTRARTGGAGTTPAATAAAETLARAAAAANALAAAEALDPANPAAAVLPGLAPGATPGAPAAAPPSLGVTSVIPAAAQVRAVPDSTARPPTFITLEQLVAAVGSSRLAVAPPGPRPPAELLASTTQIELAGTRTGLAVGQPVLIVACEDERDATLQWIRPLSSVVVDTKRGSTRIGWGERLDATQPGFVRASVQAVYGFAGPLALVGASAPAWSSLSAAQQLAATTLGGGATPSTGGLSASIDLGQSWTARSEGAPAGATFSAVAVYGDVVLAAGPAGLLRGEGTQALATVALAGGARRTLVFLGGRRERMLAAGAAGTVLQSIDDGRTWSQVTGGAPKVEGTGASAKVTGTQLPSAMVRGVLEIAEAPPPAGQPPTGQLPSLLAATDAGVYEYTAGAWAQYKSAGGTPATETGVGPVLALLAWPSTSQKPDILAATLDGVQYLADGSGAWKPWGKEPLKERVHALAGLDAVYAGTDHGVLRSESSGEAWAPASGEGSGALPAGAVTSLVAVPIAGTTPGVLLAGTAEGLYLSSDGGKSWAASQRRLAFSLDGDALAPSDQDGPAAPAPGALLAAFAGVGVALSTEAVLLPQSTGYRLTDGDRVYELTYAQESWLVWAIATLGPITALAADATAGTALAAAGALASAATEWPGFAVGGSSVEVSPPSRTVVPATRALLEQSTGRAVRALALAVAVVEQDSAPRFGRETPLTRIAFDEQIPFGDYPRRNTRLWTSGAPLALFAPAAADTQALRGKRIPLAKPLLTPVSKGRLGSVTGSPVGLAALALGGAMRISPPPTAGGAGGALEVSMLGPSQADVVGLAVDGRGVAFMATPEGVMRLQPGGSPELLLEGWPSDDAKAAAVALDATATTLLGASSTGLLRLRTADENPRWAECGAKGECALIARSGQAVAVARGDGGVSLCEDTTAPDWSWRSLPALDGAASALLFDGAELVAATATGVYTFGEQRQWTPRTPIPGGESVTSLVLDRDGTLWASVPSGLLFQTSGSSEWQYDATVAEPVEALALDPLLCPLAAGAGVVARRIEGVWHALGPAPGAPVRAAAVGADETVWIGMLAEIEIERSGGGRAQPLRLAPVGGEVGLEASDIAALDQGSLPRVLGDALAAAGEELEAPQTLVTGASASGAWLVRSGGVLEAIALRRDAARSWAVVSKPQLTLYPTSDRTVEGELERWSILVEGSPGTIRVRDELLVALPATAAAPAFAETVRVASLDTAPSTGSVLVLERPLRHVYDPATVQVNLNVVSAAHGQPVSVAIGSGDPEAIHQSFTVPSPVAAIGPTPAAPDAEVRSTLLITVAGQPWRETDSLADCGAQDPVYVVWQNADGTVSVHFGDGVHGARLPAGQDNVRASYVQGGGPAGEAAPGALIQPLDRPQLVTAVHNPGPALLPASASASASRIAAMRTLDGIVTLEDYEQAALGQAGVRSAAAQLVGGRAVIVTVAAAEEEDGGLLERLRSTLGSTTASGLPVKVLAARPVTVHASIELIAGEPSVEQRVRAALDGLTASGPGAPLRASRVLSVITALSGVTAAEVLDWNRPLAHPSPPAAVPAAGASWPPGAPAPLAAELLRIDASPRSLQLELRTPAKVAIA